MVKETRQRSSETRIAFAAGRSFSMLGHTPVNTVTFWALGVLASRTRGVTGGGVSLRVSPSCPETQRRRELRSTGQPTR
jgi:hypothetical protein